MNGKKVIVRIKGGLGNQLFCYAAARRLALANDAELVIDDVTGFIRDTQYHRNYMLDRFNILTRKATAAERMEPFERGRRALMKWSSRCRPFLKRAYIEQEGNDFDERLLRLKVNGTSYIDGLWQGEGYFKDIEGIIRKDLRIVPPKDALNIHVSNEILNTNAVALHVRWFDEPNNREIHNASKDYYQQAMHVIEKKIKSPQYFLFSDNPESACEKLALSDGKVTCVRHNRNDENAYADLWLMSQCKHFIIANSTFSWWGAWLGGAEEKIIVAPGFTVNGKTAWGFKGLLPESWVKL